MKHWRETRSRYCRVICLGSCPEISWPPGAIASFAELKAKWTDLAGRWTTYPSQLRPESLDEIVYKTSTSSGLGKRRGTRRSDVLLHLCTHAQYTTAQVINMFRHVDAANLPEVMLISLARQEMAQQRAGGGQPSAVRSKINGLTLIGRLPHSSVPEVSLLRLPLDQFRDVGHFCFVNEEPAISGAENDVGQAVAVEIDDGRRGR